MPHGMRAPREEFRFRILKGAKPADLPAQQPPRYNLAVTLKTAATLGLTIPPSLLLRTDDVVQERERNRAVGLPEDESNR